MTSGTDQDAAADLRLAPDRWDGSHTESERIGLLAAVLLGLGLVGGLWWRTNPLARRRAG